MWEIGSSEDGRCVFQVSVDGDECDDAMTWLVLMADREGRIIFRKLEHIDNPPNPIDGLPGKILIHEVDPEFEGEAAEEDTDPPQGPR